MLTNFLSILCTALAALAAGGAAEPTRKPVLISPQFSGVFFADGHAAVGAEVLVGFSGDHDHPCNGLPTSAVVDANGRFSAAPKTSQMSSLELEGVPYHSFQNYVCFRYNGKMLVDSLFITLPTDPYKYIGTCRIPFTPGYDQGMCQWRKEHA